MRGTKVALPIEQIRPCLIYLALFVDGRGMKEDDAAAADTEILTLALNNVKRYVWTCYNIDSSSSL